MINKDNISIEIKGYQMNNLEDAMRREFTAEMRRKIDFNILQKQIRNQLVKEMKKELQAEVREAICIEGIANSVEKTAMNHAMNMINKRLENINISI